MADTAGPPTSLSQSLIDYYDARDVAFLAARKTLGVGELDARALVFIFDNPNTRPRDLGAYLGITSAGVTTLTDRLVQRQALRRDIDAADRRVIRLTAIVDLSNEPWSALKRFDDEVRRGTAALDPDLVADAARLIGELTRAASAVVL